METTAEVYKPSEVELTQSHDSAEAKLSFWRFEGRIGRIRYICRNMVSSFLLIPSNE